MIDIDKKGVFIGFSSIPFQNQKEFVKKEIKERLFDPYRKGLADYSGEDVRTYEDLYNPDVYYLWGKYDICILSNVDDWEFGTREFSPRIDSVVSQSHGEMQNFDYRVILGLNPIQIQHGTVPDPKSSLPYVSITQLKLSSALLVGNGIKFLDTVKAKIESIVRTYAYTDEQIIKVNVLESFSYHELIIVAKSNSIDLLRKIVVLIRNLKFRQAVDTIEFAEELISNSLLQYMADHERDENGELAPKKLDANIIDNHLFESTFTSFGFHFDYYTDDSQFSKKVVEPIKNEKVTFFSRWNIKPGHTQKVIEIISKIEDDNSDSEFDEKFLIAGKGDLLVKKEVKVPQDANTFEFPEYYFRKTFPNPESKTADSLRKHVRETYTTVGFELGNENDFIPDNHFEFHSCLQNYTVKSDAFDKLKEQIKALWLPKPLSEKLLRILANYNNAILSPDMFVFYIELEPHIKNCIINTVDLYYQNKGKEGYPVLRLVKILETICSNLDVGYHNRFYQSYWTWEIPEVNTDYSGGIHNLISGYDSCYKALNNISRERESNNISFLNVRGNSRIMSSHDTLAMNFLYIIQPYIYSTMASHESLSFSIEKFCDDLFSKGKPSVEENDLMRRLVLLYQSAGIEFNLPNLVHAFFPEQENGPNVFGVFDLLESKLDYPDVLNSMSSETLRYLITDYMNLQVCFDNNFELFCQVRWNHFFQSGHVFDAPNKVNDTYFLTLSFRLGLLKILITRTPRLTREDLLEIYQVSDFNVFKEHEDFFNADIRRVLNSLNTDSAFSGWLEEVRSVLSSDAMRFLKTTWIDKDVVSFVNDLLSSPEKIDMKSFCAFIDKKVLSEEEGDDVDRVCDKKMSTFYMSTINAILNFYSPKFEFLQRNSKDGNVMAARPGYFLDPCGGSFITGRNNRATYLQHRVVVYKLFYHLGHLHKFNYFNQSTKASENLFQKDENS
ncbi:MAG: hypothetical protein JST90_07070 [Bacteroidetes bacterium]|nr:hypothetical protein [Bacteroidota bacterium]